MVFFAFQVCSTAQHRVTFHISYMWLSKKVDRFYQGISVSLIVCFGCSANKWAVICTTSVIVLFHFLVCSFQFECIILQCYQRKDCAAQLLCPTRKGAWQCRRFYGQQLQQENVSCSWYMKWIKNKKERKKVWSTEVNSLQGLFATVTGIHDILKVLCIHLLAELYFILLLHSPSSSMTDLIIFVLEVCAAHQNLNALNTISLKSLPEEERPCLG